ncbi:MAG: NAD(P)H-hydrate epimerase [Candidatus Omnitrophica bacterium]|nr:NAD(P)H-hydrate epimerase [Candidatus Omnitrophota bacterium]
MRQKAVSVKQIQDLDKTAIEKYGVPSLALMENAGRSVAAEVIRQVKRVRRPEVCVICGLGNNAGDGFVIARHLINAGIKTKIFLIGKGRHLKTDAAVNYLILKKLRYPIQETGKGRIVLHKDIVRADVVVDAIFGVGLNREVLEPFRGVIEAINKKAKKVFSVDTPSGIDGTTGEIYGVCVKADVTVTFNFMKKGFLRGQGPKHTGKVVVVDIGIPLRLMEKVRSGK